MQTIISETERTARTEQDTALVEFVRFTCRATRGLTTAAESEAKALIARLVKIGQITQEEAKKLETSLMARMKSSREVFEMRVEDSIRKAVQRMEEVSTRELEKLQAYANKLEARVDSYLRR